MERNEQIGHMENILEEAADLIFSLADALQRYSEFQPRLRELEAYYTGAQWRQDFEDDCAGKLPRDLKRGVLSEDAVDHLLWENRRLKERMAELAAPEA